MKSKFVILLFSIIFILTGCSKKDTADYYLSVITKPISEITDETGMSEWNDKISVYCYDFKTKKLKKIIDLDKENFWEPVYSKKDNSVYYTKAFEDDVDLFSLNLDTRETQQFTKGMKIYSEIIPGEDEIYFTSYTDNEYGGANDLKGAKPCVYSKSTGKVTMYFADSDFECRKMFYDPYNDHLYAGCISPENSLSEENIDYIYDFYKDYESPKQLIKSDKGKGVYLVSTMPGSEKLYLWLNDGNNSAPYLYYLNYEVYKDIDYFAEPVFLNENEILTDSLSGDPASIDTCNIKTKKRNTLFTIEGQELVSFKLLSR